MSLTAAFSFTGGLSWAQIAFSVAGVILLWNIISSVVAWYKLRHIPGPFFASFTYLWSFWAAYSGRSNFIMAEGQKKYGSVMRVAPDAITIFDPETLLRINSARSPYVKSPWYDGVRFDYRGFNVISLINRDEHYKRKAKLLPAFAGKNVAALEAKVDEWFAVLISTIRARIAKGEEMMEIGLLIQYFQVDMISELSMGKSWGDLKDNKDHFGYLKMNDYVVPAVQNLGYLPAARALYSSQWFMKIFGPKTTDTSGLGLFLGVLQDEVQRRFSENAEKPKESRDLLDSWMKQGVTADECQFDLALLVPAGTETSVMMVRGTLLLLMSSPRVYRTLKQEIRDGIATGRISNPITHDEAKSLEYTQAVVREGLRVMVPINFGFAKRVPESGDTICGKFIPGGTDVYPNYHALMRCKEVFGEDADIFRPERFLDSGSDVAYMSKVVDLAFGGGRWLCLGKLVALLEMNKIFVELFRNFDFQIATPEEPWKRLAYSTYIVHDFWARVTEDTTMAQ
ncbi:cytochrome P450 [Ustulina deusta]|nr:cytochrome P450 [Ustulina deusta]